MILTVRTTTGRENIVIESLRTKIKNENIPVKSLVHPEELRGYIFIEGELAAIEHAIKSVPHVRGIINQEVAMKDIEKFIVPEKQEIGVDVGDVVEIIIGPFRGEKGKVTRVETAKSEITIELLEAAIPIPVTISLNSVRIHEKKKEEKEPEL